VIALAQEQPRPAAHTTPIDVLMRRRYDAIMQEARAIEDYLGIEPKVRAVCPHCDKVWNKKVDR
jgi:hypothetical protein